MTTAAAITTISTKKTLSLSLSEKEARLLQRLAKKEQEERDFATRVGIEVESRLVRERAILLQKNNHQAAESVMGQIAIALQRNHLLSTLCGFILGGVIPIATWLIVHQDLQHIQWNDSTWQVTCRILEGLLVLGGLVFSAKTCVAWTTAAFQDRTKAIAWVILLEGTMILSSILPLSVVGLALLVCINGIATGTNLALQGK